MSDNEPGPACSHGVKFSLMSECKECKADLERQTILALFQENQELNNLFKLQHKRVDEATRLWQASTGKFDTLPDLGDLVKWLLDERARYKKQAEATAAAPQKQLPEPT